MGLHAFAWWPVALVVSVACVTDLRSRRIPNWLVFPFFLIGLGVSCVMHGWHGLADSAEGMALGLLLTGVLYCMGGMGMGDVKLCAALGAWIGPQQLVFALVVMALAGGVMAVAWALAGGFLGELLNGTGEVLATATRRGLKPHPELNLRSARARKMPYAPAIAAGALFSFFAR